MARRNTKRSQYECMLVGLQPAREEVKGLEGLKEEKKDLRQKKEEFLRIAQSNFYNKIPEELKEKEANSNSNDEARFATLIRMAAKVSAGHYVITKSASK